MLKNIVKSFAMFAMVLGLLTPGFQGINPEKADELGLPWTYYFREVPYAPERLSDACQGADCKTAANFVLNQEVTGLNQ